MPGKVTLFAASAVLGFVEQSDWSGPAFAAACAPEKTRTVTSSNVVAFAQGPLFTVHLKIF